MPDPTSHPLPEGSTGRHDKTRHDPAAPMHLGNRNTSEQSNLHPAVHRIALHCVVRGNSVNGKPIIPVSPNLDSRGTSMTTFKVAVGLSGSGSIFGIPKTLVWRVSRVGCGDSIPWPSQNGIRKTGVFFACMYAPCTEKDTSYGVVVAVVVASRSHVGR